MSNEANRDFRQRSLGCVGASMVLHVGLMALLVLAPESEALQTLGTPDGTAPGAVTVELETSATGMNEPTAATAAPEAKPSEIAASEPSEVMLASNDDPTAVAIPSKETEVVKPKAIAAPVFEEPAKPVAKTPAKPKAPKVAKAAPAPKAQTARADGDVEIAQALAAARIEDGNALEIGQRDDTVSPATSEPDAPVTEPETEEEQEIETAAPEAAAAATAIAAAETVERKEQAPEVEAPAKAVEPEAPKVAALVQKPAPQPQAMAPAQSAPIATAPANSQAIAAPMSQQATGGTTAQPGVAAARPGAPAQGQALRAGGLGYAVPMGTQIRDASELVARPGNPSPVYPQQDRLLGRQGLAVVVGRVSNDGSILSVQLERSSGSASMDQEAMKAFAKWKFMPGQQGMVRKPFRFVLSGATQELPARLRR